MRTELVGGGQEEMREKSFLGKGTAREMAQWVSYDNVQSRRSYMKRKDGARAPPTCASHLSNFLNNPRE